jgi:type III restriction enzyme
MKLKFDPNQQFQIDAISAVTDLFDVQPLSESDLEIDFQRKDWIFHNRNQRRGTEKSGNYQ